MARGFEAVGLKLEAQPPGHSGRAAESDRDDPDDVGRGRLRRDFGIFFRGGAKNAGDRTRSTRRCSR